MLCLRRLPCCAARGLTAARLRSRAQPVMRTECPPLAADAAFQSPKQGTTALAVRPPSARRPITAGTGPPSQPANSSTAPSPVAVPLALQCALRRGTASPAGVCANGTLVDQASVGVDGLRNAFARRGLRAGIRIAAGTGDAFASGRDERHREYRPHVAISASSRPSTRHDAPYARRRIWAACRDGEIAMHTTSGVRRATRRLLLGPLQLRVPTSHELRLLQQPVIELGTVRLPPRHRIPGRDICSVRRQLPRLRRCRHCSAPSRSPPLCPVLERYLLPSTAALHTLWAHHGCASWLNGVMACAPCSRLTVGRGEWVVAPRAVMLAPYTRACSRHILANHGPRRTAIARAGCFLTTTRGRAPLINEICRIRDMHLGVV
jgi:hypothetical protein